MGLGIFDGLHLGHERIIKRIIQTARRNKGTSIIITFHPHPLKILYGKKFLPLLISLEHRLKLLEQLKLDVCLVIDFNKRFSEIPADKFINEIVKKFNPLKIVVGENFTFGRATSGDIIFLRKKAKANGFKLESVPLLRLGGKIVSSTYIRLLIQRGDLKCAQRLLGRPVSIIGQVLEDRGMGRQLGFPTANLDYHHEIIPPDGVYLVRIMVKNRVYPGLCNVGKRPTFFKSKDSARKIEIHILRFSRDIYRQNVEVQFIKRIRAEKKFSCRQQLIKQLKKDKSGALQYFSTNPTTQ